MGSKEDAIKRWLNRRGGRTMEDLLKDEFGRYVIMSEFRTESKVYLPRDLQD